MGGRSAFEIQGEPDRAERSCGGETKGFGSYRIQSTVVSVLSILLPRLC
jgi:hypothetical protein